MLQSRCPTVFRCIVLYVQLQLAYKHIQTYTNILSLYCIEGHLGKSGQLCLYALKRLPYRTIVSTTARRVFVPAS